MTQKVEVRTLKKNDVIRLPGGHHFVRISRVNSAGEFCVEELIGDTDIYPTYRYTLIELPLDSLVEIL